MIPSSMPNFTPIGASCRPCRAKNVKMAELIEMPFRLWARVVSRNHRGSRLPHVKGRLLWKRTRQGMPDDTALSCAKIAELIEMLFGLWTWMGTRKHVLHRMHIDATWLINTTEPSACVSNAAFLSNCFDHLLLGHIYVRGCISGVMKCKSPVCKRSEPENYSVGERQCETVTKQKNFPEFSSYEWMASRRC